MSGSAPDDRIQPVRAIAERVAGSYGLELFDIQLRRESIGWVLRIVLDRPGDTGGAGDRGVSIEDCQRVSQDVSAILDVEDPFDYRYTLEVSSPGLDRPLRHAADYRRFSGRLAKVVTSEPIEGQTHLVGRIRDVDADTVLFEGERGRLYRVPLSSIARARLEVEF
jgi:ribosome maturation factor RimP